DRLYTDIGKLQSRLNQPNKSITRLDSIAVPVKIVRVKDGDTAEILYHDFFMNIRFAHIDAPETRGNQPYGRAAGRHLRKQIEGKKVILVSERRLNGSFGRILGTLYNEDGLNINKEMIAPGYAWFTPEYSKDQSYAELEKCARKHKLGLWKEKNPIPPGNGEKGEETKGITNNYQ